MFIYFDVIEFLEPFKQLHFSYTILKKMGPFFLFALGPQISGDNPDPRCLLFLPPLAAHHRERLWAS
jgi:hypothetical protein